MCSRPSDRADHLERIDRHDRFERPSDNAYYGMGNGISPVIVRDMLCKVVREVSTAVDGAHLQGVQQALACIQYGLVHANANGNANGNGGRSKRSRRHVVIDDDDDAPTEGELVGQVGQAVAAAAGPVGQAVAVAAGPAGVPHI